MVPHLLTLAGDAAEGSYYQLPAFSQGQEVAEHFLTAYHAAHASETELLAAHYCDATRLEANAIRAAGTYAEARRGDLLGLKITGGFQDVTGRFAFNSNGAAPAYIPFIRSSTAPSLRSERDLGLRVPLSTSGKRPFHPTSVTQLAQGKCSAPSPHPIDASPSTYSSSS